MKQYTLCTSQINNILCAIDEALITYIAYISLPHDCIYVCSVVTKAYLNNSRQTRVISVPMPRDV